MSGISMKVGGLDRADGSGSFSFGGVGALASVSGPLEVRLREEQPDKATFEIVHRPLEGIAATPSKALISTLQSIFPPLLNLGAHPRSLVQLIVQSLSPSPSSHRPFATTSSSISSQTTWPPEDDLAEEEDDFDEEETNVGSMSGSYFSSRAACINACSLAFLNAGSIGMKGIPIAVSLAYTGSPPKLVVMPSMDQERAATSRHGFAWAFGSEERANQSPGDGMEVDGGIPRDMELIWVESEGSFSKNEFEEALERSKAAAVDVFAQMREKLQQHFESRVSR